MEAHPCEKESFLDKIYRAANEIDFVAQQQLEGFVLYSQIAVALISFIAAYFMQSFQVTILAQFGYACFLWFTMGFGWPWLKRNHLEWLPAEVPPQYRIRDDKKDD